MEKITPLKILGEWQDDLIWCPSQCYLEVERNEKKFELYLRWRWDDPWHGYILGDLEKDGAHALWSKDLFAVQHIQYGKDDPLSEIKAALFGIAETSDWKLYDKNDTEVIVSRTVETEYPKKVRKSKALETTITGIKSYVLDDLRATIANRDQVIVDYEQAYEALLQKVESLAAHETCACSCDNKGDICSHHSPQLAQARKLLERVLPYLAGDKPFALEDEIEAFLKEYEK